MKQVVYPGVVCKDEGSSYGIWFPDFPGCVSVGDTVDAAVKGGREALQLHIEGMVEDKEAFPPATDITDIERNESDFSAIVLIPVSLPGPGAARAELARRGR